MHIKQQDLKTIADALEGNHFSPRTMRVVNWTLAVLTGALQNNICGEHIDL